MRVPNQYNKRKDAPWGIAPRTAWSFVTDVPIFLAVIALFYGVIAIATYWAGPFTPQVEISRSPRALPVYAGYSLLRIAIAYFISLGFSLVYGYVAAYNSRAEKFMIPALDILQSIPVLSFLPGVMLAMVSLFPRHQLGVELGAILLIFTGQVWNMAFSFYSSLKSIPSDMREAAELYRLSRWQRFTQLEIPYSTIGLIWNSMMSVAGGWFFLMACEMFVLGSRDFRIPGLGSYLQTAASAGDTQAIGWGILTMVLVIILLDQLVWRPIIAWAQKFKIEQVEAADAPRSPILAWLRRSRVLSRIDRGLARPLGEKLNLYFANRQASPAPFTSRTKWVARIAVAAVACIVLAALLKMARLLSGLTPSELRQLSIGAGITFLRVLCALAVGTAWTIPVGVWIGLNPRIAKVAQPLVQIAASVPATALFPVVILVLIKVGGGLGVGSIILLLLGTQWYVLFNVIAGATALPTDLREVSSVFRFSTVDRWRKMILPGIFPYLVTGLVTAAGGAWNASIVAEYFHFQGKTISTIGLGAMISHATDSNNFPLLLAATIVMAIVVVTLNRSLWRPMYRLAETRYRLEG